MERGTSLNPFNILLAEDNAGDADLIREALDQSPSPAHQLMVVPDGEVAMQALRRDGPFTEAPRTDLLLLDLNLPRKDGREVLAELRADPRLTHLPVIILTSSEAERDLLYAYTLHANSFVSKPLDLENFFRVIDGVKRFWLGTAKLPPHGAELTQQQQEAAQMAGVGRGGDQQLGGSSP